MDKSNDFVKVRNIFTGRTDEKRRNIWEFWRWDKDMKTKNNGWELLDGDQKDEKIDKFTQAIAMKTTEKKTVNSAEIDEINDIGAPIPQEKRKKSKMATIILRPKNNQYSGGTKPDIEVDLQTYNNMIANGMINRFTVIKTIAVNKAEKKTDIEKFTTVIKQKITPTTYEALVKEYRAIKGTDKVREKELLLKARFLNKESKFIEKELKNYE